MTDYKTTLRILAKISEWLDIGQDAVQRDGARVLVRTSGFRVLLGPPVPSVKAVGTILDELADASQCEPAPYPRSGTPKRHAIDLAIVQAGGDETMRIASWLREHLPREQRARLVRLLRG